MKCAFEIELSEEPLGKVSEAVHNLPSMKNLPLGVRQANLGDAEVMGELFVSFGFAMLAGGYASILCWCCCSRMRGAGRGTKAIPAKEAPGK